MALINWDDEEEKKKDELFNVTPVKQIASVQAGSWQPAPSGADSAVATDDVTQGGIFGQKPQQVAAAPVQENYLMSEEKAQVDQAKVRRDAEIEQARAEQAAARQRAEAAAVVSQNFRRGEAENQQGERLDVEAIKKDQGWKRYYDKEFKREKDSLDFWGRLMDGGAASRRAENAARGKHVNELLLRAYDDNGNVLDANAALEAKKFSAYNSALANDNSTRSRAAGEAIGAFDKTDSGFFGRLNDSINAMRQMSAYDAVAGVDDKHKTGIDDFARFGGNVIQGIGTAIPVGGKAFYEAGRGRGTDYSTGFEKDLDAGERAGRGVSGAIDVVGTFFGGSGQLVKSLGSKVVKGAATQAEKTMLKKLVAQHLIPSLVEGGEAGTQAAAEYFGNNGTLMDENGEIDADKVAEFLMQTGTSAGMGVAAGGVFTGTAAGVNRFRNRGGGANGGALSEELPEMEYTPVEDANVEFTPAPQERVADGIATAESTPVGDSNVQFESPTQVADGTPADTNSVTPIAPNASDMPTLAEGVTPVTNNIPAYQRGYGDQPVRPGADKTNEQLELEAGIRKNQGLDGGEDLTPAFQRRTEEGIAPIREDFTPVGADDVRALQDARAGKSQADEALINQELADARPVQEVTPVKSDNIPEMDNVPEMDATPTPADTTLGNKEFAERFMPKLANAKNTKKEIANAIGMGKDVESDVREILSGGNVKPKKAERIAKQYDKFDQQLQEYNRLTEQNQKGYAENGIEGISEETSKANRRAGRELGITMRRLQQEIKRLDISGDKKARFIAGINNAIGTRNASVLTSAGLLERNIFQEMTANTKLAIKNPIKMTKSTLAQGNIIKDTAKAELSHWRDTPRTATEVVKYLVGNTYRTAMIPTTVLANTRRGAVRQEFTRWAYKELQGKDLSPGDAKKLSGTAGNEMEALVNTFTGVDNGMSNRGKAMEAMNAWKEYMKAGDQPIEVNGVGTTTKAEYLKHVEEHNSLADQMINGMAAKDQTKFRALKAVGDLIFPFVRTAKNLAVNAAKQDLNPMAKSLLDEIRADQRSGGANAINLIKSKLVDYGIMAGAATLASSGMIEYNDGDEVDKPKGWSLKIGENEYIPVRATSLELPIAMAGTAQNMFQDITEGKARDWKYYAGMITGSLPYIDQMLGTSAAADSLANGEDGGYAAKAYAINTAKGFVPGANNGIQAYAAGKSGESLNAKTVYDDDMVTWFTNTVRKSFDPDFYNSLKDSRDNAGRVRTVDNQGVISNKTMNDAGTKEFNDRITDLVDFTREAGLGENTKDMFNSYDTGKNNNFKSVQDSITFLDAVDGKPDNTKKLEKNAKYTDLSNQIREGFYGETSDELLTLDGKNLYSDVSMPNADGTKNSRKPINMQSIKNAIAQTDLPEAERDRMYEISQANEALYAKVESKEMTYAQYKAIKAESEKEYVKILSNSKNYKKMTDLFDELDNSGFFKPDGLGSTRSGQTYLWNSLNALLGSKGATPAADYPKDDKGFGSGRGGGSGRGATNKPGDRGNTGIKWTPAGKRQMASSSQGKYTPVNIKVKLGNEVKKDRTQNYSDRSF